MEFKFLNSLSFYKAAPILSTIIFISIAIGLNTPSTVGKLICSAIGVVSFFTFIRCAKHHKN